MHASPQGRVKMDNVKLIPEVHSTVNYENGFRQDNIQKLVLGMLLV